MNKYSLELRHRANSEEPFDEKHQKFINKIATLDAPWNLSTLGAPPDIGSELLVSLNKRLDKDISVDLAYNFRSADYLEDDAQYDDYIAIEFNAGKIKIGELVEIMQAYIPAFNCYSAALHNLSIALNDWPKVVEESNRTGRDINGRDGVYRINPINYFDRLLCERAFALSPELIVERLDGKVESVSVFNDGALIIYSTKTMQREEWENIDSEVKLLLQ